MAETQMTNQPSYPQRVIYITGERVARLTKDAIRVSRIEQRLLQLNMSNSSQHSNTVDRVNEAFTRAFSTFEAELKSIEKEMAITGRNDNQRTRTKGKPQTAPAPNLSKGKSQKANAKSQPATGKNPAQTKPSKAAKTDSTAPLLSLPQAGSKSDTAPSVAEPKTKAAPQKDEKQSAPAAVPAGLEAL